MGLQMQIHGLNFDTAKSHGCSILKLLYDLSLPRQDQKLQ